MPAEQSELPVEVEHDQLKVLMLLAKQMEDLHLEYDAAETALKELADKGAQIEEIKIPDLMRELGLKEITLESGRKISLKTDYYPRIVQTKWPDMKKWLEEHNASAIVTSECVVDGRHKDQLEINRLPFRYVESIHPSTLKAFVKEQIELPPVEGAVPFPKETFSVFEKTRATIKDAR